MDAVTTNAQEIPGNLIDWYALSIFNEFIRVDSQQQYKDYVDDIDFAILKKLSKKFQIGSTNLEAQAQLSEDTVEEMEEFQRVMLVAGVCASIIKYLPGDQKSEKAPIGADPEHRPTVHNRRAAHFNDIVIGMKAAIFTSRFVETTTTKKEGTTWASEKDENLFNFIIHNRDKGPFDPWKLREMGMNYFSDSQLEELEPLYRLHSVE